MRHAAPVTGLLALFLLALCGCEQPASRLERIKSAGILLVATGNGPTTHYFGPEGPQGIEHDLVVGFARSLGVKVQFVFGERLSDNLRMVRQGVVHMAASGLTITPDRARYLRFSIPYQTVTNQVVYRRGSKRPRRLDDLLGRTIEVTAHSSHAELLRRLQRDKLPALNWKPVPHGMDDLLYLVENRALDLTVADSNVVAIHRRFYPHVTPAMDLGKPQALAWAFPKGGDDSLRQAANQYLSGLKSSGALHRLLNRYYSYVGRLNLVDNRTFWRHAKARLPRYEKFFREAEELTGLDWRLLAAVGYQESHWNPRAVSPTGVRGIMMLTRDAARQTGIKRRTDPRQSILGGARYLARMLKKIPPRIPMPDRQWLALAGYNVGFGHLEDARRLTQAQGGDPDKWSDVRQRLPLLSQKKFYRKLRFGYARGREPVNYVGNVRNYYDLLVWRDQAPTRNLSDSGNFKQASPSP